MITADRPQNVHCRSRPVTESASVLWCFPDCNFIINHFIFNQSKTPKFVMQRRTACKVRVPKRKMLTKYRFPECPFIHHHKSLKKIPRMFIVLIQRVLRHPSDRKRITCQRNRELYPYYRAQDLFGHVSQTRRLHFSVKQHTARVGCYFFYLLDN